MPNGVRDVPYDDEGRNFTKGTCAVAANCSLCDLVTPPPHALTCAVANCSLCDRGAGANFGTRAYSIWGRREGTAFEATEWVSDSATRCKTPVGFGHMHQVGMSVGKARSTITEVVTYDKAFISSLAHTNTMASGAGSITVSMGSLYNTLQARGMTACEATEWVSDSSVRGMVGQGVGGSRRGVVTAGTQFASVTQAWSVDGAGMSVMSGINVAGAGGASVTVHGASMGLVTYTGRAREGHTGCEATEWMSDSSIRCKSEIGTWGSRLGVVTSGERSGSITDVLSYDVPSMSVASPPNSPSTGRTSITILAADLGGFGFSSQGRLGFTSSEASQWLSGSSITCKSTIGTNVPGSDLAAVLTAGSRTSSLSQAFTYNSPISSFLPANQATRSSKASSLMVFGSDFGSAETSVAGRMGPTAFEVTFWISDSMLKCLTAAGTSTSLSATVTVAGAVDSATAMLSYDTPQVAAVRRTVYGSQILLEAEGINIGTMQASQRARVLASACQATKWVSDTLLSCMPANISAIRNAKMVVTCSNSIATKSECFDFEERVESVHLSGLFATMALKSTAVATALSKPSRWISDSSLTALMHDETQQDDTQHHALVPEKGMQRRHDKCAEITAELKHRITRLQLANLELKLRVTQLEIALFRRSSTVLQ